MSLPLGKTLAQYGYLTLSNLIKTTVQKRSPIITAKNQLTWSQTKFYATQNKNNKEIIRSDFFQDIKNKNRDSYLEMLHFYKTEVKRKGGHVEFIYAALKYMKEFGVEKDLQVYKSLIDIFPKGKMVPRNIFQAEFMHYPKHQQCAIDILEQMEENGVMPDWDMEDQLVNVFGKRGHPVRRYWRMMYWMPKFKNASPWPLPSTVPSDAFELALLAIDRITSVDVNSEVSVLKTSDVKDSIEDTWIVSGQSPDQIKLLSELPSKTPLYVEGRYRIWLRNQSVTYFVLRADVRRNVEIENTDDISNLKIPFFSEPTKLPQKKLTVHEQEDGIILAVCSTGTSGRDSLLSWIRLLEKTNPRLGEFPVVFTLKAPPEDSLIPTENKESEEEVKDK
ncbi:hypothetical protein O3M35_012940 [Rhynocoris fuscipes]|uniref:Evolutionarily conserved signaling intermediate in Toll pathway, mitochondrial n=1 Tax=Rhynocoris fuscipes TaxID=488301 RepID=A0AAW1CF64_9HEMI